MIDTIKYIAIVLFSAGAIYGAMRVVIARMLKDLNAVGKNLRRLDRNVIITMLVLEDKRENREFIARMFRD